MCGWRIRSRRCRHRSPLLATTPPIGRTAPGTCWRSRRFSSSTLAPSHAGEPMPMAFRAGELVEGEGLIHLVVPPRRFWENVGYT